MACARRSLGTKEVTFLIFFLIKTPLNAVYHRKSPLERRKIDKNHLKIHHQRRLMSSSLSARMPIAFKIKAYPKSQKRPDEFEASEKLNSTQRKGLR